MLEFYFNKRNIYNISQKCEIVADVTVNWLDHVDDNTDKHTDACYNKMLRAIHHWPPESRKYLTWIVENI